MQPVKKFTFPSMHVHRSSTHPILIPPRFVPSSPRTQKSQHLSPSARERALGNKVLYKIMKMLEKANAYNNRTRTLHSSSIPPPLMPISRHMCSAAKPPWVHPSVSRNFHLDYRLCRASRYVARGQSFKPHPLSRSCLSGIVAILPVCRLAPFNPPGIGEGLCMLETKRSRDATEPRSHLWLCFFPRPTLIIRPPDCVQVS
ncbi:hypothetical protein B0T22DRAFT_4911 [Podospora appendiculata]|uniref:Uncharacterized protein n=1 Tax=Podospora appendiculata TaxID=314037 RepID=A0AAE0XES5_9PEZI|nr:hypothetical protein B0T22DRAFT_4911 [Podospora appendiculata]